MAIKKIVCCTDFSENAKAAVKTAIEMAEKYQARLSIIHVLPPVINPMFAEAAMMLSDEPKDSLLLKLEQQMQTEYGDGLGEHIKHDLVVLDGHVSTEILRYLEDNQTDVVVMGSYGLSGMGLVVFGSVAKRISHKAPCSVMIVRKS
ncbi:MAG: universal stress protein [Thermodesulfobacteriota bacterium]|nr:universal stress protein [Thermodesulfobacteriota bacterium]